VNSKYPKKVRRALPEGFEYSEEAQASLTERARLASLELERRMSRDDGLRERVENLLREAEANE
jgi:hypothetical protein